MTQDTSYNTIQDYYDWIDSGGDPEQFLLNEQPGNGPATQQAASDTAPGSSNSIGLAAILFLTGVIITIIFLSKKSS